MENIVMGNMILEEEEKGRVFHVCLCWTTFSEHARKITQHDIIPTYSSSKKAMEAGWSQTDDKGLSPDGRLIWICPSCTKKRRQR